MKYEEYKICDCGWLDKIPSGWSTIPIKRTVKNILTSFIDGDWIESNVIISDGIRYLTTGNVGALEYKEQGNGHISEETFKELNCSEVFPGDMLISRLNEPIGRTCIVPDLGNRIVVAVDNVIYRPDENKYDKRYLMYQMNCLPYTENANFIARGSTMSRISRTILGSIKLCIPTLQEQQAIASYLDEKCGKINGAIDVQKKKIDLLNELKQTIITNAVTKGLNPNAPMKDSGVEWIGEVPEHWKIKRTRFLCNIQTGDKDTVNREDDGLYPFYVRSPKVERINTYSFDGEAVLMAGDGVGAGKVFHYANGKFDYHQRVYNLHNFKDVSGLFFYYYILNKFRYIIEEGAAKNTVDSVRLNMIQDFWMTIPPVSEQQNIVKYIDGEISKIDAQISKANRRIELLNELKQSIITEAVTGKIKII